MKYKRYIDQHNMPMSLYGDFRGVDVYDVENFFKEAKCIQQIKDYLIDHWIYNDPEIKDMGNEYHIIGKDTFGNRNILIFEKEGVTEIEDEEDEYVPDFYAIYSNGGGAYGRDSENWFWTSSEPNETKSEFRKRVQKAAVRHAEHDFNEFIKGSPEKSVKIFSDLYKFLKECKKVHLNPNVLEAWKQKMIKAKIKEQIDIYAKKLETELPGIGKIDVSLDLIKL